MTACKYCETDKPNAATGPWYCDYTGEWTEEIACDPCADELQFKKEIPEPQEEDYGCRRCGGSGGGEDWALRCMSCSGSGRR